MSPRRPGPAYLLVLLTLWIGSAAQYGHAQSWPAVSSMVGHGPTSLTHAWVAMPNEPDEPGGADEFDKPGVHDPLGPRAPSGCYLVHVPSRRGPPMPEPGLKAASDGAVRVATRLAVMPTALAAVDNRVYLVMQDTPESAMRRVFSLDAVPAGIGDLWSFNPPDRLRAMAALPEGGRLTGFAGGPRGPVALIDHAAAPAQPATDGGARYQLLILDDEGWRPIPMPPLPVSSAPATLIAVRDGVAIVTSDARSTDQPGDQPGAWIAAWPSVVDQSTAPTWTWRAWSNPPPAPSAGISSDRSIIQSGGLWVLPASDATGMKLWSVEDGRWFQLADVGPIGAQSAIFPLDDVGRIALIWRGREPADPVKTSATSGRPVYQMIELSAATGRVYYRGIAQAKGPISWADFRLLSLVLLAIMAVVLVIVARSERSEIPVVLPDGVSLAEPGHRFMSGLIDAVVCACGALWIWGVPLQEALNPIWLLSARGEWTLLTWVALGLGLCTITEAMFGLTPGKVLTGVLVVPCRPLGAKDAKSGRKLGIGFKAALMRNAIKWVLSPIAVLGLMSQDSRHFGDAIAGTAVVHAPKPAPRS